MGQCCTCLKSRDNADISNSSRKKEEVTEISTTNPVIAEMSPHFVREHVLMYTSNHNGTNKNSSSNDPINVISSEQLKNDSCQYSKVNELMITTHTPNDSSLDSKISRCFDRYKDNVEDAILAEGIEDLCNDLELNPDEFKVLILAWKLNACQMCKFTRKEFSEGMKNMNIDSINELKYKLNEISASLKSDSEGFKDLYRFTFKFGLDVSSGQRILPVDIAILLWRLVFTNNEPPILNKWLMYLEKNPQVRGIPKDTWYMFLNFSEFVKEDLSTYDDTEAWPSLFDDFVEYENDKMNQNI